MKKTILITTGMLLLLSACKKGDSSANNPTPVTPATYSGKLIVQQYDNVSGGTTTSAIAAFYQNPNVLVTSAIGSVKLNNNTLDYNISYGSYVNSTSVSTLGTAYQWDVVGTGTVPSFSYNDVGTFPNDHGSLVPDTISKSKGWTAVLNATTLTNSDSIAIQISNNPTIISKTFSANAGNTVIFSAADLSNFPVGSIYVVNSAVGRFNAVALSGKNFLFEKVNSVNYTVYLKP